MTEAVFVRRHQGRLLAKCIDVALQNLLERRLELDSIDEHISLVRKARAFSALHLFANSIKYADTSDKSCTCSLPPAAKKFAVYKTCSSNPSMALSYVKPCTAWSWGTSTTQKGMGQRIGSWQPALEGCVWNRSWLGTCICLTGD